MNDGQSTSSARQQIVERIKQCSNILVTVSTDPSVDELAGALGLTLMLNGLNKHATAVVSGQLPPAIDFLEPGKTFENTVDSLRDFIIALNKEKADHLRYKVDGDVVKIFITPYRTTISQQDLEFSQGDYNVELVLALGVKNKDYLDKALEAHGRILHDATVATLTCGNDVSDLGSIAWSEPSAGSISEMLVSLSEALKGDKPLLDEQISTALLTGIVAATDRFSNNKTSSKVMTMAAQLMAAGANQQLIAAKLSEAHEIGPDAPAAGTPESENSDGTTDLAEGQSTKLNKKSARGKKADQPKEEKQEKPDDGSLAIPHEKTGDVDAVSQATAEENQTEATQQAEAALADQLEGVAPQSTNGSTSPSVADLQKDLAAASAEVDQAATEAPGEPLTDLEPSMGGTLNATTEQAAEDKRKAAEDERNHTILTHGGETRLAPGKSPIFAASPMNAAAVPDPEETGTPMLPPLPPTEVSLPPVNQPSTTTPPSQAETLADLDKKNRMPHEDALADVEAAYNNTPFDPAGQPMASVGAQPLGEVAHTEPSSGNGGLPPLPDFTPPLPPPPPLPPFDQPVSTSEPQSVEQTESATNPEQPSKSAASDSADPNSFRIPGQK